MKIDIRNVHFPVEEEIRDFAVEKIGKLEKYYKNIIKATLIFEKHEGDTANVRYCFVVEVAVPGENIRIEECGKNIKSCITTAEKRLKERLIKEKGKKIPNKIHKAKKWLRDFFGK